MPTLEDLFLEADRIGNKYQTPEEITNFQEEMAREVQAIADLIDAHFPNTEIEVIDFSKSANVKQPKKRDRQTYRTVKV